MCKNLFPPIISKPILPFPVAINPHQPGRSKSTGSHRLVDYPLLILWRQRFFQDFFYFVRGEDVLEGLGDAVGRADVDAFGPVAGAEGWEGFFEFGWGIVVFHVRCYADSLVMSASFSVCSLERVGTYE